MDEWEEGRLEGGGEGWVMSGWVDGQRGEWWLGGWAEENGGWVDEWWVDGWDLGQCTSRHTLLALSVLVMTLFISFECSSSTRPCALWGQNQACLSRIPAWAQALVHSIRSEIFVEEGLGQRKERGGDQSFIITENTSEWTQRLLRLHEHCGWSFKDGVLNPHQPLHLRSKQPHSHRSQVWAYWTLTVSSSRKVRERSWADVRTSGHSSGRARDGPPGVLETQHLRMLSELVRWMKNRQSSQHSPLAVL